MGATSQHHRERLPASQAGGGGGTCTSLAGWEPGQAAGGSGRERLPWMVSILPLEKTSLRPKGRLG